MLFRYNKKNGRFVSSCDEVDFKSLGILERQDIEEWVKKSPEILGEDLLIVTTEYSKFDKTNERLDLLALDKKGKLVVIELKRDDSGKNVDLQAIKYAAYCSTITLEDIIEIYSSYKNITKENAEQEIRQFVTEQNFERLDNKPRIILLSKKFRPEVTASVLWLRKFELDITCIKLVPYRVNEDEIVLHTSTIIPLPEAKEYMVLSEHKESSSGELSEAKRRYIDFFRELNEGIAKELNIETREPSGSNFHQINAIGIGGAHFEWLYNKNSKRFGVELHFEGKEEFNKFAVDQLSKKKETIEQACGEKVYFDDKWCTAWTRVYLEKNNVEDINDPELKDWAIEKMITFYKEISPTLPEIKQKYGK